MIQRILNNNTFFFKKAVEKTQHFKRLKSGSISNTRFRITSIVYDLLII